MQRGNRYLPGAGTRHEHLIIVILSLIVVVFAFQAASRYVDSQLLFPGLGSVLDAAWEGIRSGEMVEAWARSLALMATGFAIAIVIGVGLGLLFALLPSVGRMFDPVVKLAFVVPTIAVLPLIIVWLGLGYPAKLTIIVYSSFYEVYNFTLLGATRTARDFDEVGRSFGAGRGEYLRKVVLPGSVPYILTGMRLGLGQAIVAIILAEFFTAVAAPTDGIGAFIRAAGVRLQMDSMMAAILSLGLMSLLLLRLMRAWESRFASWHTTQL